MYTETASESTCEYGRLTCMNDIASTIKELELSLLTPETRSSREALDKLLADDFTELGTSGNHYTKADILQRLPSNTKEVNYVVTDFSVETPTPDTVVARFTTERTIDGSDKVVSKRASHWRKTEHGWQMFYHEANKIN